MAGNPTQTSIGLLRDAVVPVRARFLEPTLRLAARELPSGPEWAYEIKLDGHRALGLKSGGRVSLGSGNGKDLTRRFPEVTRAPDSMPDETLIDGKTETVYRRYAIVDEGMLQEAAQKLSQLHANERQTTSKVVPLQKAE